MLRPLTRLTLLLTTTLVTTAAAPGRVVEVLDREGFDHPVTALRIEVPSDWKVTGGVRWASVPGCPANTVQLSMLATSADGSLGVEVFPALTWRWIDDPMMRQYAVQHEAGMGCEMLPLMDAATFIRQVLFPRHRPAARDPRVMSTEPMPEVAAAADAAVRPFFEAASQVGAFPMQLVFDAARVRIHSTRDGRPVEEWLAGTTQQFSISGPSLTALMGYGAGPSSTHTTTANFLTATFAPGGALDRHEPLFQKIIASIKVDPQWQAAVERFYAEIGRIQARGAAERNRIWSETQRDIGDSQRRSWERRQEVQDRIADRWSQVTRGVDTWVDPSTGERYESEPGYDYAWRNDWNELYLTNDPGDDPNLWRDGTWTRLEKDW